MARVKQLLQFGIIIVLLLAIFGVLLTPSPDDDPAGVTVRLQKERVLLTSLLITQPASLPVLASTSPITFSRTLVPAIARLDLICVRLC
jgi:hypothetical protein